MSNAIDPTECEWGISCKCGHRADLEHFKRSATGADLQNGHYQCPSCHVEWTLKVVTPAKILPGGLVIPPCRKAIEVEVTP